MVAQRKCKTTDQGDFGSTGHFQNLQSLSSARDVWLLQAIPNEVEPRSRNKPHRRGSRINKNYKNPKFISYKI